MRKNLFARLEFVYPFGKYQVKEGDKKGYFAPLSLFREENFRWKEEMGFPIFSFLYRRDRKGEDYFGLFPIYGILLDRYGKEEIHFYFWPLYSQINVRRSSYHKPALAFFLLHRGREEERVIAFGLFTDNGRNSESQNRNSSYGLSF